MSLILDALNKADRERKQSGGVPDLKTVHHDRGPTGVNERWLVVLAAAVVVLLAAVVALAVFWFRDAGGRGGPTSSAEVDPAPVQKFAAPRQDTAAQGPARPIAAGANTAAPGTASGVRKPNNARSVNAQVQALYEVQQGEVQVYEPVVQPAQTEREPRQTTIDEGLARALWEDSRTKPIPQVRGAEQVIKPAPVKAAPVANAIEDAVADAEFDNTMAAFEAVPFLHELPTSKQNTIPTLMYAQHSFAKQSVTINKKTFTVGDAVARDLRIERVLADGVLLNFKGEQFKLAALSSWVNY